MADDASGAVGHEEVKDRSVDSTEVPLASAEIHDAEVNDERSVNSAVGESEGTEPQVLSGKDAGSKDNDGDEKAGPRVDKDMEADVGEDTIGQQVAHVSAEPELADAMVVEDTQVMMVEDTQVMMVEDTQVVVVEDTQVVNSEPEAVDDSTWSPVNDAAQEASAADEELGGQADAVEKEPPPSKQEVGVEAEAYKEPMTGGSDGSDDIEEGEVVLDNVPVDDTQEKQADHGTLDTNIADTIQEEDDKLGNGSVKDDCHDRDEEASIPMFATLSPQADLTDTVPEVQSQVEVAVDGGSVADGHERNGETSVTEANPVEASKSNGEDFVSEDSKREEGISAVETYNGLQDGGDSESIPNHTHHDVIPRAADDQEMEVRAQESDMEVEVGSEHNMDVDQISGLEADQLDNTADQKSDPVMTDPNQDELVVCEGSKDGQQANDGEDVLMMGDHDGKEHQASDFQTTLADSIRKKMEESESVSESVAAKADSDRGEESNFVGDSVDHRADCSSQNPDVGELKGLPVAASENGNMNSTNNGTFDAKYTFGENTIVYGDTVLDMSHSMVETNAWKEPEVSEIHSVGEKFVDLLHDTDLDREAQLISTLVVAHHDKQNAQVGEVEHVATIRQHISYNLPSIDTGSFSTSDLVWGKVKSHPWWPGQIIDPSDASQLALKYRKRDSFLVAYYGDKTFAWCDESQLKPFFPYFSQMEKQCSSDIFATAMNEIMAEISRRLDLGMALTQETYFQKIDNAGVRRGDISTIVDRSLVLDYFHPRELVGYVQNLALFPNGSVGRLELAIAKSQLKAFYRSKGCSELPEFTVNGGLVEDVPEVPPANVTEASAPAIPDLSSGEGKPKSKDTSSRKRKHVPVQSKLNLDGCSKLIPDLSSKKHSVFVSDSTEAGKQKNVPLDFFEDIEPISPPPAVASSFKIGEFIRRAASQLSGAPPIVKSPLDAFDFPQDDPIRDDVTEFDLLPPAPVENKPIVTTVSENTSPYEMLLQLYLAATDPLSSDTSMVGFFTGFRNSRTPEGNRPVEKRKRGRPKKVATPPLPLFTETFSDISSSENVENRKRTKPKRYSDAAISDISSSEEKQHAKILSSQDQHVEKRKRGRPKKVVSPAAGYDSSSSDEKQFEKPKRGRPRKVISELAPSDMSAPDHMNDSYWSETKLKRQRSDYFSDERHAQIRRKMKLAGEQSFSLASRSMPSMKYSFIADRPIISVKEKMVNEQMPTALVLSFNSSDIIPSPTNLIRTFSRYGPLKEAETEVHTRTNRAKVVFKRRTDAETAFSSAGKYSLFGPGLLSYQLKNMPCILEPPQEAVPVTKPEELNDMVSIDIPGDNLNVPAASKAPNDHEASVTIEDHDMTEEKKDADSIQDCNLTIPEVNAMMAEAESELALERDYDVTPIPEPEQYHDAAPIDMKWDTRDLKPVASSGDYHDAALFTTSQDYKPDVTAVSEHSDNHHPSPIGSSADYHDVTTNAVSEEYQAVEPTVASSDATMQDATSEEYQAATTTQISAASDLHDVTANDACGDYQAATTSPIVEPNVECSDFPEALPSASYQDDTTSPATAPVASSELHDGTALPPNDASSEFHVATSNAASEIYQAATVSPIFAPIVESSDFHDLTTGAASIDHQATAISPIVASLKNHEVTPNTVSVDIHDATPNTASQCSQDAMPTASPQENCDATQEQSGSVMEVAETQVEDTKMSPIASSSDLEATPTTAPEYYQDTMPTTSPQDNCDTTEEQERTVKEVVELQAEAEKEPPIASPGVHEATSQDCPDTAPTTSPQENSDPTGEQSGTVMEVDETQVKAEKELSQ